MKKQFILLVLILGLVITSSAMAAETTAMVNNPNPEDRLNLRTAPNEDAPTLGKYYNGVHVELLGSEKNGWRKVRFGNLVGYMRAEFLETDYSNGVNTALPYYIINNTTGTGLNLRESQSTKSKSLGFYANGASGWVYGVGVDWCHVQAPDGKVGFMLRKSLSPVPEFEKGSGSSDGSGSSGPKMAQVHNPDPEDRLNLRTEPDAAAPTLGKYYNGVSVELIGAEKDGWVKVRIGNLMGYMLTEFLETDPYQMNVEWASPYVFIENKAGTGLHLRESPSTKSASRGLFLNGEGVYVYGVSADWCHVQAPDGRLGFMLRKSLSPVIEFDKGSGK